MIKKYTQCVRSDKTINTRHQSKQSQKQLSPRRLTGMPPDQRKHKHDHRGNDNQQTAGNIDKIASGQSDYYNILHFKDNFPKRRLCILPPRRQHNLQLPVGKRMRNIHKMFHIHNAVFPILPVNLLAVQDNRHVCICS